ncbi:hypothetical protein HPB48_026407 [Haemaphysalis longicornis]|uniref:Uncharacterized protein n=1 Tax=Haemaphysalis longicornis TaxID=44386 RepID=A0A9J6HBX0_HAELO|nr:hypothetical protein HPB48_026407 [Haemaphysalis longicornis]
MPITITAWAHTSRVTCGQPPPRDDRRPADLRRAPLSSAPAKQDWDQVVELAGHNTRGRLRRLPEAAPGASTSCSSCRLEVPPGCEHLERKAWHLSRACFAPGSRRHTRPPRSASAARCA